MTAISTVHRAQKGFTLIELLVVIAIIAILASILFPVFARARENARRASCQSNEKNLALAIMQYSQDYDERLPSHWIGGVDSSLRWIHVVQPYIKSKQVFYCPSASKKDSGAVETTGNIAYGYNYRGLTQLVPGGAAYERMGVSLAAVNAPSETLMLGDSGLNTVSYILDPATTDRLPSDIHLEGCNFTFVDGHVKWLKSRPVNAGYNTAQSMWDLN